MFIYGMKYGKINNFSIIYNVIKGFFKKNIIENLFFYLVNLEKLLFDVE